MDDAEFEKYLKSIWSEYIKDKNSITLSVEDKNDESVDAVRLKEFFNIYKEEIKFFEDLLKEFEAEGDTKNESYSTSAENQ
jgi:hypothetical protein